MTEKKMFWTKDSKEVKCRAEVPLLSVDLRKYFSLTKLSLFLHIVYVFCLKYYDQKRKYLSHNSDRVEIKSYTAMAAQVWRRAFIPSLCQVKCQIIVKTEACVWVRKGYNCSVLSEGWGAAVYLHYYCVFQKAYFRTKKLSLEQCIQSQQACISTWVSHREEHPPAMFESH